MTAQTGTQRFLKIEDIAERLRISKRTAWRWRDDGTLPAPVKLGGRLVRWDSRVIERWVEAGCPRARKAG